MTARDRTVAVVQATPVLMDRPRTLARLADWVADAAPRARLVMLPESFVPGYPRGLDFGATVGHRTPAGRALWRRLWEQAVTVPGPDTDTLAELARTHDIWLAVGVTERSPHSPVGTLFCSLLLFDPQGELRLHHRKLKPTGAERVIWGEGDGRSLTVVDTPLGRVGGLICWENYMPLARAALYAQGVDIWLAPTADARESWLATLRHIACEGRCHVLGCNQFVRREDTPADLAGSAELLPDPPCPGGSAIVSPLGDWLAGPLWQAEGILTAELDPAARVEARFDLDVTGHTARPDIFTLLVHGRPAGSNPAGV